MKCPHCGRDVPRATTKCWYCDKEIAKMAEPSDNDIPSSRMPSRASDDTDKGLFFIVCVDILIVFLALYLMTFVYLEMVESDPWTAVDSTERVELAANLHKYSELGMFIFATLSILSLGFVVFPSRHN